MWDIIIHYTGGTEKLLIYYISNAYIIFAVFTIVAALFVKAPYGRYTRNDLGFTLNAKFAWLLQELPSLMVPLYLILFTDSPYLYRLPNKILLGLFFIHYVQRSLIFPVLIKGGKPTPVIVFLVAVGFCSINGYLQAADLLRWNDFGSDYVFTPHFIAGVVIFLVGMIMNIHSDFILRNLRKPGEKSYKIPKGGMFKYVSGANFLGEILEWWGFAVAAFTFPTFAFAVFTTCNIGPRACHHHRWYKDKFEDYPKSRTALIPFIF